jgi:hypothetical protein
VAVDVTVTFQAYRLSLVVKVGCEGVTFVASRAARQCYRWKLRA